MRRRRVADALLAFLSALERGVTAYSRSAYATRRQAELQRNTGSTFNGQPTQSDR